jgi:hypothetical protein
VQNPALWVNATGWQQTSSGNGTIVGRTAGAPNGGYSYRLSVAVAGTMPAKSFGGLYVPTAADVGDTVVPNSIVSLSVWVRSSVLRDFSLNYSFQNAAGAAVGANVFGPAVTLQPNVWTRLTIPNVTVHPIGVKVRIGAGNSSNNTQVIGETVDVSMPMVEVGPTVHPYFDGQSVDAGGYYYSWLGTPNASPSLAAYASIDPCSYCSDFALSYLPPNSAITVDGKVKRAYASVAGTASRPASNLLYGDEGGPMSWSELTCGVPYLMSIDVPPDQVANVSVSVQLTRQE